MVAFGHSAVGASIGVVTYQVIGNGNPILGLIAAGGLGMISHYVCDFIPHGHLFKFMEMRTKLKEIIIFDVFLSLGLFLGADFLSHGFTLKSLYLLFSMGGALVPDWIDVFIHLGVIPKKSIFKYEFSFHAIQLHWHGALEKGLPMGLKDIWQLATVFLALYLILK